jgi:hypothetical protein
MDPIADPLRRAVFRTWVFDHDGPLSFRGSIKQGLFICQDKQKFLRGSEMSQFFPVTVGGPEKYASIG